MTFLQSVRDEIISKPIKDKNLKKAFLTGVIRGNGNLFSDEEGLGLDFSLKDERAAAFVSELFTEVYGIMLRDVSVYEDALNKSDVFTFSIRGEEAEKLLFDLGVLIKNGDDYAVSLKFYGKEAENSEFLSAFFKGLFLSSGKATVPSNGKSKKTRYHAELAFSHSAPAFDTADVLGKVGVAAGIVRRKNSYVVYAKSGEEMKNFFAFLKLPATVLKITDLMVSGEMTNMINRRKNCDIGNVVRQMDASEKQSEAISYIEKTVGLDYLVKPDLISTAKARKDNPEDSVFELSNKLFVSKSCLNHRFRKIISIAEELKSKGKTKV